MCGHPFIKWNLLFFFLSAMVGLSKLQVVLLKMAPAGQVQRKRCGYFTQVMYADRTEAPERGSYETGCWYPSFLVFLIFSPLSRLSLREWGTCHWLWGLWEVTIFGTFEMFTPKKRGWGQGNNQNTLNISFWIHMLPDTSISDTRTRRSRPDK